MMRGLRWMTLFCCLQISLGLLCYNCSATQTSWNRCAGEFAPPHNAFNTSRNFLTNCTGEDAMCFVRAWRARAKYAWIVQRGCYEKSKDDPLPQYMSNPTRAMSCRRQRLAEADYQVCLCQADWCNSAHLGITRTLIMPTSVTSALAYIINLFIRTL